MSPFYHNSDLALSSALIAWGFGLSSLHKEKWKLYFYFPASHDISQFVEEYFLGKTRVDPLAYAIAQKNLKNYLFNSNTK